ncbi:response regulator transcription factor [Paenibacillus sp. B2(2019)]|nr:response regulator transcription factor [Paenibacillus sp. B2(2019)]KAA1183520.1 response regulator transcription factor [Paenibacillus sp. B2(2019)]
MPNIKVLIADDNSFIREGMRIILTTFEGFEVVATVQNGQEAVAYCERHEVDVALLDVRMPEMNGVEATKLIVERTATRPLILTTFDDDEYIRDAITYGAKGYLLKNNDPERICDAIKTVYYGHNVLQDTVLDKLKSDVAGGKTGKDTEPSALNQGPGIDKSLFTERELDIMALIAKGRTNKEISKQIYISEGTIANHVTSILGKTGLTHRTQIAIYYLTGELT